jgi:hypothetical protein
MLRPATRVARQRDDGALYSQRLQRRDAAAGRYIENDIDIGVLREHLLRRSRTQLHRPASCPARRTTPTVQDCRVAEGIVLHQQPESFIAQGRAPGIQRRGADLREPREAAE